MNTLHILNANRPRKISIDTYIFSLTLETYDMNTVEITVEFDPYITNNEEKILEYLNNCGISASPGMYKIDFAIEHWIRDNEIKDSDGSPIAIFG